MVYIVECSLTTLIPICIFTCYPFFSNLVLFQQQFIHIDVIARVNCIVIKLSNCCILLTNCRHYIVYSPHIMCQILICKFLPRIAGTVARRLFAAPAHRHDPCQLDGLSEVTIDEVDRLSRSSTNKSLPVDFTPSSVLKSIVNVMVPLITRLANMCFSTGVFPLSLKQGRVTRLLKKPGLYQSDMANYRPITNSSMISKILERLTRIIDDASCLVTANFSDF